MLTKNSPQNKFFVKPVTKELWNDLCVLFGKHGAYGGCWCMWWRIKRSDFAKQQGEGNKRAFKQIIDGGTVPGLLGYNNEQPIAWCSVAPREQFPVLDRSHTLKRVDDKPVWSLVCFFIAKEFRRKELTHYLIKAAIDYARQNGASIVEAYPLDKEQSKHPALEAYTGFASTFLKRGFKEVIRRSANRPIMRYFI